MDGIENDRLEQIYVGQTVRVDSDHLESYIVEYQAKLKDRIGVVNRIVNEKHSLILVTFPAIGRRTEFSCQFAFPYKTLSIVSDEAELRDWRAAVDASNARKEARSNRTMSKIIP